MEGDVLSFAQVAVIIVGLVASLTLIGVTAFKVLSRPRAAAASRDQVTGEQIERLQQSIDAVAIEVERIAEAQRFSARLLSERTERSSLSS